MGVNEYAEQVVQNFITDITDHLFISIERDDEKMRNYMENVTRFGKKQLNMAIGRKMEVLLELEDIGKNPEPPQSRLITGYTRYRKNQRAAQ